MGRFQWLKGFDRDPAYVNVNYHGRKIHQSRTGGCISLLFLISVIFIVFFKIWLMMQQNRVIFETRISKDTFDTINLADANITLTVLDSNYQIIACKKLKQYGIKVTIVNRQQNQEGKVVSFKEEELTPRVNSQIQFDVKNINMLNVKGRPDVLSTTQNTNQAVYQQFFIQVKATEGSENNSVVLKPIIPQLKFTNHVINQQMKDLSQAISDNQHRMFRTAEPLMIGQSTVQYTFEIKKVVMNTDFSVVPSFLNFFQSKDQEIVEPWFYGEEFTTETYLRDQQSQKSVLFLAYFIRSMYTNTYIRHFDKLDIVMAESFGLIGLLSILLFCLYKGYNNWVLERENIGEQKQTNIFDYYKYQARSFCYFIADNLKRFFLYFKCYSCLKRIKNKLCCCLFRQNVQEEIKLNETKKNRLEDELDLYKSRRQINFLRKKVKILTNALCQKFPELKIKLDKQIRLSLHYQMSASLMNESEQLMNQNGSPSYIKDQLIQSNQSYQ